MRKALRSLTFFACSMVVLGVPRVALAQCTQTLSVGANIASAVASAPNGSTICLNSGNYGNVAFSNISRTGFVTLTSVSGVGARMSPRPGGASYIRFKSLTLTNGEISGCSTHIEFVGNTWVADAPGAWVDGSSCPSTPQYILFDGDIFDRVQQKVGEGRLYLSGTNTITIKNTVFSGNPSNGSLASDAIQMGGGVSNVTIGPGNYIHGLYQASSSGPHVDGIQIYQPGTSKCGLTITGNYFDDNTVHIGFYDGGCPNVTISNNIFDRGGSNAGGSNCQSLQIGGIQGMLMEHNTFHNSPCGMGFGTKSGMAANSGWVVRNNIFDRASFDASGDQPGCGSGCVMEYNLKSNGATTQPTGTNSVTGTAVYMGTLSYATWSSWQLAPTSPGHNAAKDGADMGTLYYGAGAPPPPPPPGNKFTIGQQVTANTLVNVRQTPAGTLLGTQDPGSIGWVTNGPVNAVLNGTTYTWWNINFNSGVDGWVGEDTLDASTTTLAPSAPSNVRIIQ